jgi:WKF domain
VNLTFFIRKFLNLIKISAKKRKRKALPEEVMDDPEEPTNSPVAVTENLNKEISKNTARSKKRAKHVEIQKTLKDKFVEKRRDDIDQYLHAWKQDRSEWKFQKVKQIFIEKQIYNAVEITDDLWPITLEYLAGSREATKEGLLKEAQKLIGQFDDSEENKDASNTVDEKKYKRARDIMQTLQC